MSGINTHRRGALEIAQGLASIEEPLSPGELRRSLAAFTLSANTNSGLMRFPRGSRRGYKVSFVRRSGVEPIGFEVTGTGKTLDLVEADVPETLTSVRVLDGARVKTWLSSRLAFCPNPPYEPMPSQVLFNYGKEGRYSKEDKYLWVTLDTQLDDFNRETESAQIIVPDSHGAELLAGIALHLAEVVAS